MLFRKIWKLQNFKAAPCHDLKEAICDVAASVAEVKANQPNLPGFIISFTDASESWTFCSWHIYLPASLPLITFFLSSLSLALSLSFLLLVLFLNSLLLLSNHRRRYYFCQSNKVAWSQRTAGSGEGKTCSLRSKTQTCYFCYACPQSKEPWDWKRSPSEMERDGRKRR